MKKIIVALGIALSMGAEYASAVVHVRSYVRRDGTFVQAHQRSDPDSSVANNWSTYPNVNPYTGATGTRHIEPEYIATPRWGGYTAPVAAARLAVYRLPETINNDDDNSMSLSNSNDDE